MKKERIDKVMLLRGLVESRAKAQALILAGDVLVREQRVDKPGQLIDNEAEIRIKGERLRYVGRGGLKLEAALREFEINAEGKKCLDIGASTGGFTDCLLQHGAACVWAIDVGHNQIAWPLRQDPRVVVLEGQNARYLDPDQFPFRFELATVDVSFISLTRILPSVRDCLAEKADCIALIKPQFEVGKGEVGRGGIVTDPEKHRRVLIRIGDAAAALGLPPVGLIESPITGADGNREFLIHLRREEPAELSARAIQKVIDSVAPSNP
ncbi:MAG TPA: TlyA family RNA methyltransferase [Blastocatellia bacterium]|nr:TlyA family RNA methyltransferase [Blastocatellia bacterium]